MTARGHRLAAGACARCWSKSGAERMAPVVAVALGAALLVGCASSAPPYQSYSDVEYGYLKERTVWSSRASLKVRMAELGGDAAAGLPVVFLHPWGFSMAIWADVAPKIADGRRVLLVDLPGHGKSDKTHTPMPMKRLAATVIDAMDAAGIDRAILVGNSLGGATSVAVAEAAPERVAAMVLLSAPGGGPLPEALHRLATIVAQPSELKSVSDDGWWLGLRLTERSDSPLAQRLREDIIRLRGAREFDAWCRSSLIVLRSVMNYAPTLERVTTPAMVIYGDSDWIVNRDLNRSMATRLPNAELRTLEGCGHLPEIECPDQLLVALQDYLRQQAADGAPATP